MIRMVGKGAVVVAHGHQTIRPDSDGVLTVPPELEARVAAMGFVRESAAAEVVATPSIEAPPSDAGDTTDAGTDASMVGDEIAETTETRESAAAEVVADPRRAEYQWLVDNGLSPAEAAGTVWPDGDAPSDPLAAP